MGLPLLVHARALSAPPAFRPGPPPACCHADRCLNTESFTVWKLNKDFQVPLERSLLIPLHPDVYGMHKIPGIDWF